jgi:hypothetical protein
MSGLKAELAGTVAHGPVERTGDPRQMMERFCAAPSITANGPSVGSPRQLLVAYSANFPCYRAPYWLGVKACS